ncbi:MAG: DNA polymerase ligase N-terminal domain-containing protein [Labilithrix sp.]
MPRDAKKLQRYREMRSPEATNEPFGYDEGPTSIRGEDARSLIGAYVVHLHDATRRHYDVRLEAGGELLSFAVPHGPSLDPAKKHLAVRTEDHPIEYLEFEDVIPHGEYGGGPMIAWDRGTVTYLEGPPEDELAQGKLHVELRGMKLRGRWAFVKLAKSAKGNEWLFFKKADEASSTTRDLIEELPRSVFSGLTVEELEQKEEIAKKLEARAKKLGAKPRPASLAASRSSPLATAEGAVSRSHVPSPPSTRKPVPVAQNLYDADLGGVRVLAVRDGDVVTLRRWTSEAAEDLEAFYPEVVRAMRALPSTKIAIDGELVAFDVSGRPNRAALARRASRFGDDGALRSVTDTPVVLVATDLLSLGELDTRMLAIEDRRALLEAALPALGFLRVATPLDGEEEQIVAACASLGIGAAIAKPHGSMYGEGLWRRLDTGVAPPSLAHIVHARSVRKVSITNRDKVFWPATETEPALTKGDLVDYYAAVADVLVPFLVDRPLILVRYPDGIEGKNFYQWNVPPGMPAWVRTITVRDEDERPDKPHAKRTFLVSDAATLQYIANLGCIPLHVLASRAPNLDVSDFFTIDFDVKQSTLANAITLARTLHDILEEIGLPSYPKTSGQSGLHVLVPLGRGQSFDTARALADLLGRLLVEKHPDIATMDRVVSRRGERVYVDTGQTGTGRAIVAPYSVRAVPGARVSTPLAWSEVTPRLDPGQFTIGTVPKRIEKKGNLLAGLLEATPDIAGAVARLALRFTPGQGPT